jgi:hypothetical protein
LTLDKYQFEPAGVFILDAPEEHSEKISDVTKFVSEIGGGWRFWRGSLSPWVAGKKASDLISKQMKGTAPELLPTFNYIVTSGNWEEHVSEEKLKAHSGIPDCIYQITSPWLAYGIYGTGCERRLLVRQSLGSNTWRVVTDPIGFLGSMKHEGWNVLDILDAQLAKLQSEGKTRWGIHKKLGALDFTRSFTEFEMEKRILEDRRFFKDLVPFTNDASVPAEAYFPLSVPTETGKWGAWAKFETQIPPNLVPYWRAGIRGIIDARNTSRQILYLYDRGYTGKSFVVNTIQKIMTGLSATLDEDALKSPFWFSGIYGARMINMPDVLDLDLLTNPKIKRYTGRDYCRHEAKGLGAFDVRPNGRIIAHGNEPPRVDINNPSEMTRLLFFSLIRNNDPNHVKDFVVLDDEGNPKKYPSGPLKGQWMYKGNPKYLQDLEDQFWNYMAVCTLDYERLCPTHGDIAPPEEMLEIIAEKCATGDSLAFTEMGDLLEYGTSKKLSNLELRSLMKYCEIAEDKFSDVRKRLLDVRGVRDGGKKKIRNQRCLLGVGLKDGVTITMGNVAFTALPTKLTNNEDVL